MTYFQGRVHSVIYEDPAKAFYILKMLLDDDDEATKGNKPKVSLESLFKPKDMPTVRGHVPGVPVQVGSWFGFEGKWTKHEKYGRQIVIIKAPVLKNGWDPDTAEKMLASNGVAERVVSSIRKHFGDDEFIQALDAGAERLEEVDGLAQFSAAHVAQRWEAVKAYFQGLAFLGDLGLPPGKIKQVWSTFGDDAEQILSKNPWKLVQVDGITFQQADEIAQRMGLDLESPERLRGAVLYACKSQRSFGHLYLTTGQLSAMVGPYLGGVTNAGLAGALTSLHKDGLLVLDRTTRPGTLAVYEPWCYEMEKQSASMLMGRVKSAGFGPGGNSPLDYIKDLGRVGPKTNKAASSEDLLTTVYAAIAEWGDSANLTLSEAQKDGIINALVHPVSILTGLPGTGKTTSLKAAVRILQEAEIPFLLCAPTGIAAKRLATLTGAKAYTIHRAFAAKGASDERRESTYAGIVGETDATSVGGLGQGESWGYSQDNPHPARVVIVDESSMVDQHLLYRLLTCTAPNCRLVFVGDHAQLPSVGPGNVLRDLINSDQFPVVKLTDIFRQTDTSGIVYAAHAVHRGDMPDVEGSSDFKLLQVMEEPLVLDAICKIAKTLYDKRANFQILSPRHSGAVGVTTLNARLRELLNPKSAGLAEIRMGEDVIREDDRIMIIQNNYKLEIFNGDVGKVSRIDRKAKEVEVKIHDDPPKLVNIPFQDVPRLIRLAYACTVHKAQGLEYDHIIIPVVGSFRQQLQRNLYYTAITRAKKRVILVGNASALAQAVANSKEDGRNTLFIDRLQALAQVSGPTE